jgi:hypothetical protein
LEYGGDLHGEKYICKTIRSNWAYFGNIVFVFLCLAAAITAWLYQLGYEAKDWAQYIFYALLAFVGISVIALVRKILIVSNEALYITEKQFIYKKGIFFSERNDYFLSDITDKGLRRNTILGYGRISIAISPGKSHIVLNFVKNVEDFHIKLLKMKYENEKPIGKIIHAKAN